jgi:Pilus formation protein N terminal region
MTNENNICPHCECEISILTVLQLEIPHRCDDIALLKVLVRKLIRASNSMEAQIGHLQHQIRFLYRELGHPDTLSVTLTTGECPMNIGDQSTASVVESSSKTGAIFPLTDPAALTFAIDNTAVASVSPNGDGTATVTGVAVGSATLTVTDPANGLVGTVAVVVSTSTDAPDTLTVTLTPIVPVATANAVKAASKSGAKPV